MNKKSLALGVNILAVMIFLITPLLVDYAAAKETPSEAAVEKSGVLKVKGKVKAVSNKAKTVSVTVEGKGVMMFKFNDATQFINAESGKDINPPTAVIVKYKTVGPDKIATDIIKALVKLPAGVKEIQTAELEALIAKGPETGNYYLVDARPANVASAGHIPTAVSIPVNVLKKNGAKLLPTDKNKLLIFYCGGPT